MLTKYIIEFKCTYFKMMQIFVCYTMFLFFSYSCAIELEYSLHVIILTYELAYSVCACDDCDMFI
jgi:hypothetical protein